MQHRNGIVGQRAERQTLRLIEVLDERLGELGYVFAAVCQWRHRDRHHVQTMVQLLAKVSGFNLFLEVFRRRRNHTQVDTNFIPTTHALKLLVR